MHILVVLVSRSKAKIRSAIIPSARIYMVYFLPSRSVKNYPVHQTTPPVAILPYSSLGIVRITCFACAPLVSNNFLIVLHINDSEQPLAQRYEPDEGIVDKNGPSPDSKQRRMDFGQTGRCGQSSFRFADSSMIRHASHIQTSNKVYSVIIVYPAWICQAENSKK